LQWPDLACTTRNAKDACVRIEDVLLHRLKAAQASFALESLKRPQNRDSFEYGYRVGVVSGYDAALDVLFTILEEEKNSGNDL
jgi:hypothetical protein